MAKQKVGGYDLHAPNVLPMDRRAIVIDSLFVELRPRGAKSSKVEDLNMKVKEHALCTSAKTTIDFATTTMKKA